jgi:hypothetical protein
MTLLTVDAGSTSVKVALCEFDAGQMNRVQVVEVDEESAPARTVVYLLRLACSASTDSGTTPPCVILCLRVQIPVHASIRRTMLAVRLGNLTIQPTQVPRGLIALLNRLDPNHRCDPTRRSEWRFHHIGVHGYLQIDPRRPEVSLSATSLWIRAKPYRFLPGGTHIPR